MDITRFQRRVEDFECEHCHTKNIGTGYTNHCSNCLYSKHVDIFPGDRKDDCGGIMPVTRVEKKGETYVLEHTCSACGHKSGDHVRQNDNFDAVIAEMKASNERLSKK